MTNRKGPAIQTEHINGPAGRIEVSRLNAKAAPKGEMLFVHGAWSSAWYWRPHFMPYFASAGWNVAALSLRGHGASEGRVRWASAADYAADVRAVAEIMDDPLIVGHSMGGFVAQNYAARYGARGVGLLAAAPPGGVWPTFLRTLRSHPLKVLKVNLKLDLHALVEAQDDARRLLYSREPGDRSTDAHLTQLQSESYRIFLDMLLAPIRQRLNASVFVLGATDDRIFEPADVVKTAAFHGVTPVMIDGSHMATVDDYWRDAADALASWADDLA